MPYACSADVATRPRKWPVRVGSHPAPVVEGPLMTYTTSTDADEFVRCCIAGCGPAGAILGLLLARAGVEVVILEKHADFLRDFRGDTIHPSTLEILDELGLAERFLKELPHTEISQLIMRLPSGAKLGIDFRRLSTPYPFLAFVPQWDFLRFVTTEAARYPRFRLIMQAEVEDLIVEGGQAQGVRYRTPEGPQEIRALLTIGADGRVSRVREAARLPLVETSPPMDVLWFRLSRHADDEDVVGFRLSPGRFFALINRGTYWQMAHVI